VVAVEYLGADSIVTCEAGAQTLALRAQGRVALPPGTSTSLTFPPDAVHLFDAATGRRRQP
jgi:sn-glycerol 3-phosphate transport system ATP-binding protein